MKILALFALLFFVKNSPADFREISNNLDGVCQNLQVDNRISCVWTSIFLRDRICDDNGQGENEMGRIYYHEKPLTSEEYNRRITDFGSLLQKNNKGFYMILLEQFQSSPNLDHHFIIEKENENIYLYQSFEDLYSLSYSVNHLKTFDSQTLISNLKDIASQEKKTVIEALEKLICYEGKNCNFVIESLSGPFHFFKIGVFIIDFSKYHMYERVNIGPITAVEMEKIKKIKEYQEKKKQLELLNLQEAKKKKKKKCPSCVKKKY